jgi:ribosomal protein S18 acetylase RimI-like enzyme
MQTDILRITPATSSCLARIAVDVFDADPAPAYLDAYLKAPNHALFVAIADGEVVGQVRGVLHAQPDLPLELYLDNLGVTPALKRQGIGARLVRALIAWGRDNGARSVWLGTETDNDEARAFYDAIGFTGETMAYYVSDCGPSDGQA